MLCSITAVFAAVSTAAREQRATAYIAIAFLIASVVAVVYFIP
jgi:hypothetical protein